MLDHTFAKLLYVLLTHMCWNGLLLKRIESGIIAIAMAFAHRYVSLSFCLQFNCNRTLNACSTLQDFWFRLDRLVSSHIKALPQISG